jgi:FKBP-type peptidyl-prolyl cis-trans isomerase SlyD
MPPEKIQENAVVTLQYKLRLDDGTLVEESEPDDPLVYLHGHENIIPGLEKELAGMRVGDRKTIVVDPEEGYGDYDPEDIGRISKEGLPDEFDPEVGMLVPIIDEEGNEAEVLIIEITDEDLIVDFNHPMAGERLHFEVEITGIREAEEEELEHGHVHMDDDDDFHSENGHHGDDF